MTIFKYLVPLALVAFLPVAAHASGLEGLDIVTATGTHHFEVEVMHTEPELERGLMNRHFMPADHGMLFDFGKVKPVMMWMKNTYIPLDMVFINPQGKVINIIDNAEPLSETVLPSSRPALAALEINGGIAAKIGLKAGDQIIDPLFHK